LPVIISSCRRRGPRSVDRSDLAGVVVMAVSRAGMLVSGVVVVGLEQVQV
jgi:hypothetical protein